jgi:hypothetical protein
MIVVPTTLALALVSGSGVAAVAASGTSTSLTASTAAVATTPATATLAAGATQTFSATLGGTSVAWAVDGIAGGNATVGTIAAQTQAASAGYLRKAYYTAAASSQAVSVVAGDLIIVGWTVGNSPGATTCSDGDGNTYQAIGNTAQSSGVDGCAYAFYGIAKKTTASLKISVTSVDTSGPDIFVNVVGGMSSSSVLDTAAIQVDSASSTTHSTGTLTTTSANDFLFTVWAQDSNITSLAEMGTGFTLQNVDFVGNAASAKLAGAAGSYKETVSTSSSVTMGSIIAAFRPGVSTASATYTAPASGGSHTITAVSGGTTASGTVTVTAPAVTVKASPTSASTNPGGTVAIAATVTGSTNTAVSWTVDGVANGSATVGTITGSGNSVTYTAPASAGTHTVLATSAVNPADSASTSVAVVAAAKPITVAVNPTKATVAAGGTAAVTATVSGSTNTAVTWTVDGVSNGNATVGTITGTGSSATYTAPSAGGTHTVLAISAASATASASLTVTVTAPVVTVALNPSGTSTLVASKTLPITATVTGSTNTAVTWTVDGITGGNATVGTLTGSGAAMTYTAPSAAGSHTVTATSVANTADSASTVLAVTAASSGATTAIVLTPSVPTVVGSKGSLTFSASMTGSTGDTANWSVDGVAGGNATVGTISAAGVYACPTVSTPTVHTITATSAASPGVSASVRIMTTIGNTTYNAKTGYGATGNGSTDDTAAINKALAAAAGNICYLPAGTYMVNSSANDNGTCAFQPAANTCLYLATGAILKTITQTQDSNYRVVLLSNNNTSVVGGEIAGDRAARNWTDNAWHAGDGVNIANNSGSVVLGTYIHDNNQDGIYIFRGSVSPTNFTISDVVSDHNRRQALSITEGNTGTFQYSTFSNTNGYTDAGSGVDLEPAVASVTGITINQCSMINNYSTGISGGSSGQTCSTVTVKNCTITGNGNAGGIYVNDGADHWTFTNNTLSSNGRDGIRLSSVSCMTVNNNTCNSNAGFGMYFSACDSGTSSYHGNTTSGNKLGTVTDDGTATAD